MALKGRVKYLFHFNPSLHCYMKIESKRFVIRKSLIGKNAIITVNFKNGKVAKYSHDKVYEVMKDKLESMNCFIKYKSYTASNNVPLVAREICE